MEVWAQYGLAGLVAGASLALVAKAMDRVLRVMDLRRGGSSVSLLGDPLHLERIREIHEMGRAWEAAANRGRFSCVWRDREEIRDLLEAIRESEKQHEHLAAACSGLTLEVRNLAQEMRHQRSLD